MATKSEITLTRAQVREIDRRCIDDYGIPGIVLMENAGRGASDIIRRHAVDGDHISIICGRGNNGGDGFVIARHLANAGLNVEIFLACDPAKVSGDAGVNLAIAQRMKIPQWAFDSLLGIDQQPSRLARSTILVDAVLGTGFSGDVRSPLDLVIHAINETAHPARDGSRRMHVVTIDVPSGLDCDTGRPSDPAIRADETITFVARKAGFDSPGAAVHTGLVHVVDIGAPLELIREVASGA